MANGYYGNANGNNGANGNGNGNAGGNGHGVNIVTMMDCRIAGPADYLPAHIKQGAQKPIQAQANFTVFQNIGNKKMSFQITAWGKMADIVAKGCATGKQIHLVCTVHSYRGRVWIPTPEGMQPQFVTLADGQPLLIEKTGFTVESLLFGEDSMKTIQEEINAGFRPHGWNDPSQPGYNDWREICRRNNSLAFNANMQWFGYARVRQVNGQLYFHENQNNNGGNWQQQNQQAGNATQYRQNTGAIGGGFNQNQNNGGGWQQNQNNNGGNPEYVNGQYVGQQMPNQQQQQQNNSGQYNANRTGYNPNHQFQPNQNQTAGNDVVM